MNTCISSEQLILHQLDELDPKERSAVAAHLLGCGACRAEQRRLQAALALVGSRVNDVPVPDLTATVLRRVAARRRFSQWRSLGAAAAILALLVTGGIWYARPGTAPVAPARETAVAVAPATPAPAPGPAVAATTVTPAAEPAAILVSAAEADELFDPEERELWRMLDETAAELDAAGAHTNGLANGVPGDAV